MKVTIYLPDALAADVKAGLTDTNISAVCRWRPESGVNRRAWFPAS
jgi:hypothetical protein